MLTAPRLIALASLILMVALSSAPLPGAPVTASANPAADALVTSGPADGPLDDFNYGGAGALAIAGAMATRSDVTPAERGIFQTLLRFNVTQIRQSFDTAFGAGNWTIQSASLRFTQSTANNALYNDLEGGEFAIDWISNDAWVEGTGSPNTPTTDGISYDDLPLAGSSANLGSFQFLNAGGARTYNLALPGSVTADIISDSAALISFRLYATDEADSEMSYRFTSTDNMGSSTNYPLLTIVAVPEPSGAVLAVGGFAMIGVLVARRNKQVPSRGVRRLCISHSNWSWL